LKTYHEIAQPIRLLKQLRQSMRSGARLGIVTAMVQAQITDLTAIQSSVKRAGFELIEQYDFVKPDGMDYWFSDQSLK